MAKYDYSVAREYAEYVRAIAMVESGDIHVLDSENENCPQSDGGRARGLFGYHPARFAEAYGRSHRFPRDVAHTYVEAEICAMASEFDVYSHMGVDWVVQAHQQGEAATLHGARNPGYLEKFTIALNTIHGAK